MRRICTALLALATLATTASASTLMVGPRLGSSIPDLRDNSGGNDLSTGYSSRVTACAGVFADMTLNPTLSLQLEADFVPQGGKRDGIQIAPGVPNLPPGTNVYADFKNEAQLDYLEVPLLVKMHFGEAPRCYVCAGPYAGFLLSAHQVTSGTAQLYYDKARQQPVVDGSDNPVSANFDATTDVKSSLNSTNYGVQFGLGAGRHFGSGEAFLDLRGELGLSNIQKDAVDGKNQTGALVVSAGYAWKVR